LKICRRCGGRWAASDWSCRSCGSQPVERDGIVYFAPDLAGGTGGDAGYQHDALWSAEQSHFWFRGRERLVVWALQRYFPSAKKLLDVGCGRGSLLSGLRRKLPGMELSGAEVLDAGLQLARRRLSDVALYQLDATALPFDREFDVVTSCDVLEHLDDDGAVVRELFRSIVPGGGIIVTVPQHRWLWSAVDTYNHHRRRYHRRELLSVIERAGFVVERVTSFVTTLLPIILLSRMWHQCFEDDFDPTTELRINAMQNTLFGKLLDADLATIRLGASLPVGSSLFAVARRPGD
jgi:2-polyprenyl-3-methyl-5-hydroxy-6-metoxy-1,4-benzoquinol methylase